MPQHRIQETGKNPSAKKSVTILVLEDEDDSRILLASALRCDGYTVLEANHPYDAIRILENYRFEIDLVIIDILLPEIDGDDVARKMLAEHPFLRIIFASAISVEELEDRISDVPFQCFLQKPFTLVDLREAVSVALLQGSALEQ